MKLKLTFVLLITLVLVSFASAQSIKTEEARQLKKVERLIKNQESLLEFENKELKRMSSDIYSESQRDQIRKNISSYEKNLATLYEQRKMLLTKEMSRTLPNTQIELLKIIILQNEKIIDLLEEKQD
ncbi:MAG: hypothetical protein K1X72_04255 [Pyrinomonadaceae bacterium]|nr:hypothetical protein [Pyrinomonadaceae bacterium]